LNLIMNPLSGKTALVTGASRGTGRASALALAKAGAQVLVHYCREDTAANEVVAQIRAAGGHAEKIAADLRAPDGPHRLANRARVVIGARLDVLVCSAGMTKDASIEDTTVADFDELFALNARAPYFLVQQLMPAMCKGSCVVLVSSQTAHARVGTVSASAYAASKGAADTLVKYFATTLGARGVRVNAIALGGVATGIPDLATRNSGRLTQTAPEKQMFKRIAQAADVGGTVVFLASDAARWITGETLCVDGGSQL
jgi:NAD(P)-dependent dehydrogenase (short-subunit alcohol dehydrogenase family)